MNAIVRISAAIIVFTFEGACLWAQTAAQPATPSPQISAEQAKKCRALAIKVYPTQRAGTRSGNEEAQRNYFRDCITKGGNVPN